MSEKKLRITLVKSTISSKKRQRMTLQSLGLTKINQTVDQVDNPAIRGMIAKVSHMVKVEELEA
jgi:large subunit ribosomal protein L30